MSKNTIKAIDFSERRKQFLKQLGKGVAVFPSSPQVVRNNDVHHPYRQDSNFFYLTGFHEPSSSAIFSANQKEAFQIFVEPRDKTKELWEGKILGPARAKKELKADVALPSTPESHFDDAFVEAMSEADVLYYRVGVRPEFDQRIFHLLAVAAKRLGRTGRPLWPIVDPDEILGEMRLVKSAAEIQRLEIASDITARAHMAAMQQAKPGMYEYEVEAILYQAFRGQGAGRVGYSSIVASGSNACVLHYVSNDQRMGANDLLLIDAGAEFDYYTADITRCFPVSGKFTEPQAEIYNAVLNAQLACIKAAKPGATMKGIHEKAVEVLIEELRKLKILKGTAAQIKKNESYREFFPHGTGHWLGMDVHDIGRYYSGDYKTPRKLKEGYAFTIEPGLYFGPGSSAPAKYKGIGVRIEDDILITKSGCQVMTSRVPKEIGEIEALCNQSA